MGEEDQAKDEFILHFMIQDQFRGTGRTVCWVGWVLQARSFRSWSSVWLRIRCVLILRVVSSTSWRVLRFCAKKKVFLSPLRLLINYFQCNENRRHRESVLYYIYILSILFFSLLVFYRCEFCSLWCSCYYFWFLYPLSEMPRYTVLILEFIGLSVD